MKDPFTLPDKKGGFTQPNQGDAVGNLYMTYGIDLETNPGRVQISEQVKKLVNDSDNAEYNGYAGSIGAFSLNGSTGKIFAVSGKAFSASISDPLGTWSEETAGSEPDSGNTIMDSAFFNSLFLVTEALDIKSWNGSTWASWWQTTLGQSALDSGERHLIWVGASGNLFVIDSGNKVYRVTKTGTVTKTGSGTLDLSATSYEPSCVGVSSSRSFIGTRDLAGEEAVIVEWDESPGSAVANKFHPIGAKKVLCIAIWKDIPIAILSNGKTKYFNGTSFVDFDTSVQFPSPEGHELSDEFIHPNGWAIIDDLPHFLVTGRTDTQVSLNGTKEGTYRMPAGIWCLNPTVGIYHRFALGTGLSTQEDYGKMQVREVGALFSLQNSNSKFLASYEYYLDTEAAVRSVLVYHDATNTQAGRGFIITPFIYSLLDKLKTVEKFHKKLASGEKMRVFYRNDKDDSITQSGTWVSQTQLNIVGINLGVVENDVAFVKMGPGSGQLLKVQSVTESTAVTTVIFSDSNTFATTNDLGVVDFLNFRFMGEVSDTTKDEHMFSMPSLDKKRKTQFLFEFQQAANNKMELDFAIIS